MSEPAIRVRNLGKRYRIGGRINRYRTLRDTIPGGLVRAARRVVAREGDETARTSRWIWAVRDIGFDLEPGETLGVIGRNGSGKSTLFKLLSRITRPTEGWAEVRGRVGSLLEVGTGFHLELTGRENVYLAGAILGMTRAEISRRFDEIVAFAEVERFLDTPVKHYSSGMFVRLGFAVAAHLETEMLIVDEVLAVGDVEFQRKCLGKMKDAAGAGRTVLFVSHNMAFVRQLCSRAMVLHDGRLAHEGPPGECIDAYLRSGRLSAGRIVDHGRQLDPAVALGAVRVNGSEGDEVHLAGPDATLEIEVDGTLADAARLSVEARLADVEGAPLAIVSPGHFEAGPRLLRPGPFRLRVEARLPRMTKGEYVLSLAITEPGRVAYWDLPRAVRLLAEGTPTLAGGVMEYRQGAGAFVLDGKGTTSG
jgi:homopolymeric O-antigen transport system ATP-binding protein